MDQAQSSRSFSMADSTADSLGAAPINRRTRRPLSAHPAFAPMLGVWGAGLGGALVMVLPVGVIEACAAIIPGDLPPQTVRLALAGCSALALALVAFGAGRLLRPSGHGAGRKPAGRQGIEPFDPASELGSDSFDAPLPAGLFAKEADWLPEEPAAAALAAEAAAQLAAVRAGGSVEPATPRNADLLMPQELDLAQFAALPGRTAVWVREPAPSIDNGAEPAPAPAPAPASEAAPQPNPDPALVSAIARLRAVPPAELSLCEMVERFAAALQDYQALHEARAETPAIRQEREALLHEALGALGRVTGEGLASPSIQRLGANGPALRARLWAEAEGLGQQRGAA